MVMMENPRKYGNRPYEVALVHGGPGAAGEMAPVAKELSKHFGVLEPLQTEDSISGQASELASILDSETKGPVVLIGHSWGAWLSLILASTRPELVRKLILVGCGPFEERYTEGMMKKRLGRLSVNERLEVASILEGLRGESSIDNNSAMLRFGKLMSRADSFAPIASEEDVGFSYDIHRKVWGEAEKMRGSGKLLEYARSIECPVLAIHGDHDVHPYEGVREPLKDVIRDFRLILLERCGHDPWNEKFAKDRFYEIIRSETVL